MIQFLGGAGTVTGSKYLLQAFGKKILIDCGLFQGEKELRLLNWKEAPVDVTLVDLVLLTHGHLDHCGFLPRIVKDGYNGPIYGTAPSLDIASIVLKDSARLQEEDAHIANNSSYSKHKPALPLYDSNDVENTLSLFHSVELDHWISVTPDVQFRFRYNGHILGASFIEIRVGEKKLVFSGDIGRDGDPLLYTPEKPEDADILLLESTYGNRIHRGNPEKRLIQLVNQYSDSNGSIIIPSFAVERTQLLMFLLWRLRKEKKIPNIPIYMDSPMGLHVFEVFQNYGPKWHKLTKAECREISKDIIRIKDAGESKRNTKNKGPRIIIAGSGMATGGRVLSYMEQSLGDNESLILLVGYQAAGTRGRKLLRGDTEIKIRGKYYEVRCDVESIDGLSAHADQSELLEWISHLKKQPEKICIVHGEPEAAHSLREKIEKTSNGEVIVPELNDTITFEV
ncbi:MBL fold metallo-hydrolase [Leptospira kobayashii]|uniref:MBL fold metallo-hydrolase n=1 Tax=Leptospira kobayashii TaxID=1917830 RepID=A0ABM7UIR1_9LEPT|nr:MBL fold metallo-hydrolase [Leptospira kobayashii]BDA78654.1 MBL fold metallo-hydrolase [Leptospira kobayashii]